MANEKKVLDKIQTAVFGNPIKVRTGRYISDFGDGNRLKSDIALATNLPSYTINEIVDNVKKKLSRMDQPIKPYDIATTTHVIMIEMKIKSEGDAYMNFTLDRQYGKGIERDKILYIPCSHCNTENDIQNRFCISCGAPLNKSDTKRKLI
jgi:hypothetical protein